jgi:uncharacterized membrane protein
MGKGRLEAFSDGVLAIIITIMVLELKAPKDPDVSGLAPLIPALLSYTLSFIYIGIYWNNHHHLFQAAHQVNGRILWANLHLLFWLSLIPLVTNWNGETNFAPWPVAVYGTILLLAGFAYYLLAQALVGHHGKDSKIGVAVGSDRKGIASLVIYILSIPTAFVDPRISCGLFIIVALIWLVPDRRIERVLSNQNHKR